MRAEGECPDCERKVGTQIAPSLAATMKSTIKRVMDKDGNGMRCSNCEQYVYPDDVDIVEDY